MQHPGAAEAGTAASHDHDVERSYVNSLGLDGTIRRVDAMPILQVSTGLRLDRDREAERRAFIPDRPCPRALLRRSTKSSSRAASCEAIAYRVSNAVGC
jgi:hypothetical protein